MAGPWESKGEGGPSADGPRPPRRPAIVSLWGVSALLAAAVAAIAYWPGRASSDQFKADYAICIRSESPSAQFQACTRVIESRRLVGADLSMMYNNRGVAHWRLDRFDDAIGDYERALKLDPANVEAHVNKGNAHAFRGEFMPAMLSYHRALALDPRHPLVYRNLGNVLWEMKELPAALNAYGEAIAITPDETTPYHQRAGLLMEMKRYNDAIADFDAVVRLDPRNARAIYRRGTCWEQLGDRAKAEVDYAAAHAIDPGIVEAERNKRPARP